MANSGTGDDGTVTGKFFGINAFSTIQDGVDFTSTGGIVHIISGAYTQNVIVTKSLELAGWGQGNTTVYPSFVGANTGGGSLAPGASNVILVQSSGVTIHDLTVDGDNTSLTSGIVLNGAEPLVRATANRALSRPRQAPEPAAARDSPRPR